MPVDTKQLPADVLDALERGQAIEAMIEAFGASLRAGAASGLAPGEMPRTGSGKWIPVALVIAAALAWYFFR
jgi:hypothetical protein